MKKENVGELPDMEDFSGLEDAPLESASLAKKTPHSSVKKHAEIMEPLDGAVSERFEAPKGKKSKGASMSDIKARIESGMRHQFEQVRKVTVTGETYIGTGVEGVDAMFSHGIPRGASVLVAGGPGSGKTIFCLQTLYEAAKAGEKCFYMTFEEDPERLRQHMLDFGWDPAPLEKSGHLMIKKVSSLDVTRQIDAMLEKEKGELLIDLKPLIVPKNFKPDRIVVDSLSAIASAFYGREETYRLYVEQLFKLFTEMGATSFLVSETPDPLVRLTVSGVEEFIADGVIVMYNIRHGNIRENALEILKMRGAGFRKKIVPMEIKSGKGIVVYPEEEVFTTVSRETAN